MSSRKCIVSGCKFQKTDTFHRIPKKEYKRLIWLDRLNLPETANLEGRVCSKHFSDSDFDVKGNGPRWLKSNSYPKQAHDTPVKLESEIRMEDNDMTLMRLGVTPIRNEDGTEWEEIEINIDDLPLSKPNDTIADLQMNCTVFPAYRDYCTYEEHNYSKFAVTRESDKTKREWSSHRRRELRFDIKFCNILRN